jgi:sigma-B regulation protein RsbU (phosphoserine phosphatase)
MQLLNKSVYKTGRGEIRMSFFIGMVEPYENRLTFCNASHPFPFQCKQDPENPDDIREKKSLNILKSKPGEILGNRLGTEYHDTIGEFNDGDSIVLYTDGILEAVNPEDKMYGKGKFMKSIYKMSHKTPSDIRENILGNANSYFDGIAPDDDITIVVIKKESLPVAAGKAS